MSARPMIKMEEAVAEIAFTTDTAVSCRRCQAEIRPVSGKPGDGQYQDNACGTVCAGTDRPHEPEWSTDQLTRDFSVAGFQAPFCVARRKADDMRGSLEFSGRPRRYYGWQEVPE
jgi:hypothetical protein